MSTPKTPRAKVTVPKSWADDVFAGAPPAPAPPAVRPAPAPSVPLASDPLTLVRRILKARDPAALAELEVGLAEAGKGETWLASWLARPVEKAEEVDPLAGALAGLAAAVDRMNRLAPTDRAWGPALTVVSTLSKTVEGILQKRPPIPTTSEVRARIQERADDCVDLVMKHTRAAAAKLKRERGDLGAWAAESLAPRDVAELERRLAAMLGEGES